MDRIITPLVIVEEIQQLDEFDRQLLLEYLACQDTNPLRAKLLLEFMRRRASGAFEKLESLAGKYANPNIPPLTEEELQATLYEVATEWEEELEDYRDSNA